MLERNRVSKPSAKIEEQRMHVLILNYEYPPIGGGAATQCEVIAEGLAKKGHVVTVLTSGLSQNNEVKIKNGVKIMRLAVGRTDRSQASTTQLVRYITKAIPTALYLAKKNTRVLAFFSLPSGIIALPLRWFRRSKYIVSLRGMDVPGLKPEYSNFHRKLSWIRKLVVKTATLVTVNSSLSAKLSNYTDATHAKVIFNAIDLQLFQPNLEIRTTQDKFLYVGRLSKNKNVDQLLRAFANLLKKHPSATLEIVGDGAEQSALKELSRHLGCHDSVQWHGWKTRNELPSIYASAIACINPSSAEGFPNIPIEALSCGCPVILSDIPPHLELQHIIGAKDVTCISERDKSALVSAMQQAIYTTSTASSSQYARHYRVTQNFAADIAIQAYERELQALITK
jgi:glycosyltransferase involved in cell wall biosynthesis